MTRLDPNETCFKKPISYNHSSSKRTTENKESIHRIAQANTNLKYIVWEKDVTKIPLHFVYRDRKEPSDEHRSQKNDPATVEKDRIADAIP